MAGTDCVWEVKNLVVGSFLSLLPNEENGKYSIGPRSIK